MRRKFHSTTTENGFVHRVQQSAVGSDHEYGADNALAHLPVKLLLLPYAVVFYCFKLRVGQQHERQRVLLRKLLMGRNAVLTDAYHFRARFDELAVYLPRYLRRLYSAERDLSIVNDPRLWYYYSVQNGARGIAPPAP